jgi:hypothetical protein
MLKRPTLMRVFILTCLAAVTVLAADVTGKWSGEMNGPNGGMTLTANFKQDGTKLTGTMDGPGGEPMQIQDGRVDGDKIVFAVAFNDMKIVHEGTIKGDEITLQIKMDGGGGDGPGPIRLKRVK